MVDLRAQQHATDEVTPPVPDTVPGREGDGTPSSAGTSPAPPELPPDPLNQARRRPTRWTMLVAGLSALLVALLVGAVVMLVHNHGVGQRAEQRLAALAAAQKVATDMTTISAENGGQQIETLIQESTGAFRDQISGDSATFQAALKSGNVASTGVVTAAGVDRLEADTASVLVVVTAMVSDAQTPQGAMHTYRLSVQLQQVDDRWLISGLEFVS